MISLVDLSWLGKFGELGWSSGLVRVAMNLDLKDGFCMLFQEDFWGFWVFVILIRRFFFESWCWCCWAAEYRHHGRVLLATNTSNYRPLAEKDNRIDPLDSFHKYRGGYDVKNKHYWAVSITNNLIQKSLVLPRTLTNFYFLDFLKKSPFFCWWITPKLPNLLAHVISFEQGGRVKIGNSSSSRSLIQTVEQ